MATNVICFHLINGNNILDYFLSQFPKILISLLTFNKYNGDQELLSYYTGYLRKNVFLVGFNLVEL